jgi:hypothetical protein
VAENISLHMGRVLGYRSVGKGKSAKEAELFSQFGVEGLPLEMQLKSKKEKADVNIYIINLQNTLNDSVFSTHGNSLSE